jgi:hypothetical protein
VAHGQQGQFDIAADREFFENAITVGIDGLGRQAQLVGDDLHFLAADDHQGDLDFPLRQASNGESLGLEGFERQLLGNLRADIALAGKHQADGLDHSASPAPLVR